MSPREALIYLIGPIDPNLRVEDELIQSQLFRVRRFEALPSQQDESPDLVLLFFQDESPRIRLRLIDRVKQLWGKVALAALAPKMSARQQTSIRSKGAIALCIEKLDTSQIIAALKENVFYDLLYRSRVQSRGSLNEDLLTRRLELEMGSSARVKGLIKEIRMVAKTDFRVLIVGETGTGKELVAKSLHDLSSRAKDPFKALDCGAVPEALFESLLFGHEKGAFTGAQRSGTGFFRAAARGTLFLDEVSSMDYKAQSTLLRAIEEGEYYRVGGSKALATEFRILSASNKNLAPEGEEDAFRRDLYFRLSEYVLHLPALRERPEDIPYLVRRFLKRTCEELKVPELEVSEDALDELSRHPWLGNVRELKNCIRRAVLLAALRDESPTIEPVHLWKDRATRQDLHTGSPQRSKIVIGENDTWKSLMRKERVAYEKRLLKALLTETQGNVAEIARRLKADYKSIHGKVKAYGLRAGQD